MTLTRAGFALLSCSLLAAPGCRRATYGADDRSRIHVGIVFDIGGKDDRSFNAAAWAGVKCAETGTLPDGKTSCGKPALGIVLRDVEPGTPSSVEPAMRAFASDSPRRPSCRSWPGNTRRSTSPSWTA